MCPQRFVLYNTEAAGIKIWKEAELFQVIISSWFICYKFYLQQNRKSNTTLPLPPLHPITYYTYRIIFSRNSNAYSNGSHLNQGVESCHFFLFLPHALAWYRWEVLWNEAVCNPCFQHGSFRISCQWDMPTSSQTPWNLCQSILHSADWGVSIITFHYKTDLKHFSKNDESLPLSILSFRGHVLHSGTKLSKLLT